MEIDLGTQLTITKLAVQGDSNRGYGVTSFSIAYSTNGAHWEDYTINGNIKVKKNKGTSLLRKSKDL